MPRSGSTLLFNILREILATKWHGDLTSGWIDDLPDLPDGKAYLIKIHNLSKFTELRAQHIFYTYRDVRTATISAQRKFGRQPSINRIRNQISEYSKAKRVASLCIKYEELIRDTRHYIVVIADRLEIDIDPDKILTAVTTVKPPSAGATYSRSTLLHPDHFTNTEPEDWRTVLSHDLQSQINQEFDWWFRECGYPLE